MPFGPVAAGQGAWRPAGRPVAENGQSVRAVYETTLSPPGGTQSAGIAWLDTGLLAARLYSGSVSPGGGPYRYTAPIQPTQAATLVAAFNGGFKMNQARGGYYTEGRMIDPLRAGAASLVIYADGNVGIGAWGRDVTMTPQVVSVRQNLLPLVAGGRPTPRAASARWQAWGSTCGAASCGPTVPGIEHQWRSGLGITADGALVYVAGPALDPLQLAQLLVRAGAVRGMQLDINPDWPVFVTYDPPAGGRAAAANGRKLLSGTVQGPSTFFEAGGPATSSPCRPAERRDGLGNRGPRTTVRSESSFRGMRSAGAGGRAYPPAGACLPRCTGALPDAAAHRHAVDASPVPPSTPVCPSPGTARRIPGLDAGRCDVVPERAGTMRHGCGSPGGSLPVAGAGGLP